MLKFRFAVPVQCYNLYFLVQITCIKGSVVRQVVSQVGEVYSIWITLPRTWGSGADVKKCSAEPGHSSWELPICQELQPQLQWKSPLWSWQLLTGVSLYVKSGIANFYQQGKVTFYFYCIFQFIRIPLLSILQGKRREAPGFFWTVQLSGASSSSNFMISVIPQTEIGVKLLVICNSFTTLDASLIVSNILSALLINKSLGKNAFTLVHSNSISYFRRLIISFI